jgi:CheY-like chemotaxis protein
MADQIRAHPVTWAKKGTDMIRRNGERLLNLVNQILDLSKLEAGQMPVRLVQADLVQYIRYIVESFHSAARHKRIGLTFLANRKEMVLDYDPDKIMDILSNLIANALKFTPEGGKVEVKAELAGKHPETLHIAVQDNGPGIPSEAMEKVFDRYFQASPVGGDQQGTGLGLALTQELVHLLGGEIQVESEEGRGTTFFITLPVTRKAETGHDFAEVRLQRADADGGYASGPEVVAEKPGTYTLLLVEDSPDVVTYLQAVLSTRFQLLVAQNGREGLEMARKTLPDLIVSDIMMPGLDGLEMSRQLKEDLSTSHIPIILLTARSDQQSRLEGLRTGADAYLAKPFDKDELLVRIDKLIELRVMLQERYRDMRFLFENNHFGEPHPEDRFMREVQRLIESHMSDPEFGVPQLCNALGMSRSQCYKKFKALTGQHLADFIRRVRLHKARQLFETTDLNVSEVAAEAGFRNLSAFSRSFKREFGVSPKQAAQ